MIITWWEARYQGIGSTPAAQQRDEAEFQVRMQLRLSLSCWVVSSGMNCWAASCLFLPMVTKKNISVEQVTRCCGVAPGRQFRHSVCPPSSVLASHAQTPVASARYQSPDRPPPSSRHQRRTEPQTCIFCQHAFFSWVLLAPVPFSSEQLQLH